MKVSLKVRDEQRPLVRAKMPLNVLGLPLFTGVTSGDARELALHLGTDVQAGPSFRVSYKPNNVLAPFSVLVKTGFGLWGSPNGAALAMCAEFNVNSGSSPSFSVRLKPRIGDFGFRKDSGSFKASYHDAGDRSTRADEITMGSGEVTKSVDTNEVVNGVQAVVHEDEKPPVASQQGSASANGDNPDLSTGSGSIVTENDESVRNGNALEKSDSIESKREIMEYVKMGERGLHGEDKLDEQVAELEDDATVAGESSSVRRKSWLGGSAKGWKFHAHSSFPLGKLAAARVRWQVNFGSNLFHDVRQGFHISDIKLPALSVDKVSFELHKNRRSSSDLSTLGFGYGDDSTQLGRIAAMCTSMRYQLQLLHLENKVLKSAIDDYRGGVGVRRPGAKGSDLMIQEETALRSQMFDELNGKLNGGSNSKTQSAPWPSSGKGTTSKGEDFTINADASEGLQKAIMNATGAK